MAEIKNDGSGGIQDPIFILPPGANEIKEIKPDGTYFKDTTLSTGQNEYLQARNFLANIPPPNTGNVGGPDGGSENVGNPFLKPNALVAFFMAYTELSNIARQMSNAGLQLMLTQMSMGNELAKAIKEQKKVASEAEASMYIASAISNFADVLGSAIQIGGQMRAQRLAEKSVKNQSDEFEGAHSKANDNVNKLKTEYGTKSQEFNERIDSKKANVTNKHNELLAAERNPNSTAEQIQEKKVAYKDAENELSSLRKEKARVLENKQGEIFSADQHVRDTQRSKENYRTEYTQKVENTKTTHVELSRATSNMISKAIQGAADLAKASFALQKGAAEGQEAILNSYLQNVNKQEDQLREYMKSAHDLVSQLMQALQKFSDDEKKLGSSIATQSTG